MVEATIPSPATDAGRNQNDVLARSRTSILIVDDEPGIRNFLQRALARQFGLVEAVESAEAVEPLRARCHFDILIVDISLPGRSGIEWVEDMRRHGDRSDVIFITAYADLNATIGALRVGAADFILKPFRVEQLLASVDRCLTRRAAARSRGGLGPAGEAARLNGETDMIGRCAAMAEIHRIIERIAPTPASVLIEGETGSGKELVAAAIHRYSGRRGAFVAINCIAIAPELFESELFGHTKGAFTGAHQSREGLFAAARGGTLFLDEISEMPLSMQAKLLRTLEDRRVRPVGADHEIPIDVRLVTATNQNLSEMVGRGLFREDLYFRLNVVDVRVPSLRERRADIPELLDYFSRRLAEELGVTPYHFSADDTARLQAYAWPGNVRDLRNVVERTLLLGRPPWESIDGSISESRPDLDPSEVGGFPATWTLEQVEKFHTLRVLGAAHGNKSEAARRLGISRKTLERKLSSWPEPQRPAG
jgi:two-component system NtrC family response regulator